MNKQLDIKTEYKNRKIPDKTWLGLVLGLIFPIIGIIILYFFWGTGSFGLYIRSFTDFENVNAMRQSSKIVSLSMFAMLVPFNFFLNKRKYYSTRGVIIATCLYAVLILLYNFVWQ